MTGPERRFTREQLEAAQFDCIVLDLKLPKMSGFALLETVKSDERFRDLPVIVTSRFARARPVKEPAEGRRPGEGALGGGVRTSVPGDVTK